MSRWKVTIEIQDGWRKDAEGIKNIDSRLERINILLFNSNILLQYLRFNSMVVV